MKKGLLSLCLLGILAPASAHADSKILGWWWPGHWKNQDFKPYYQDGQLPHNTQWEKENWAPADWVYLSGSDGARLIGQFYTAGIITDQYVKNDVPSLEVGSNFYHLSGYDKGRVAATVDHVYQVTRKKPGVFYLVDQVTEKVIGYYSPAAGLILE